MGWPPPPPPTHTLVVGLPVQIKGYKQLIAYGVELYSMGHVISIQNINGGKHGEKCIKSDLEMGTFGIVSMLYKYEI